jgi:hypothetical protein
MTGTGVRCVDETTSGERHTACELPSGARRLTPRELIRRRVAHGRGPVRPDAPDVERQAEAAVRAFTRGGFLVLVGDRQIEDLDAELDLSEGAEVTFLRLVPLVGG